MSHRYRLLFATETASMCASRRDTTHGSTCRYEAAASCIVPAQSRSLRRMHRDRTNEPTDECTVHTSWRVSRPARDAAAHGTRGLSMHLQLCTHAHTHTQMRTHALVSLRPVTCDAYNADRERVRRSREIDCANCARREISYSDA